MNTFFLHRALVQSLQAKHMKKFCLLAPLLWPLILVPSFACACTLLPVVIKPAAVEPTDTYIGKTAQLELHFHNEEMSGAVDVFPEPPLLVKQLQTQTECAIKEGGVWVRQHVYAGAEGRMLVTHEYSGSSGELNFYDTRTCKKRASVDVSNLKWVIDGNSILITPTTPPTRPARIKLDAACLPMGSHRSLVHR
jgi:hypothetical protein